MQLWQAFGRTSGGKIAVDWFRGQTTRVRVLKNEFEVPNRLGSKAVFWAGHGCLGPFVLLHSKVYSAAVSLKVAGSE